jgi:hypothetical protein
VTAEAAAGRAPDESSAAPVLERDESPVRPSPELLGIAALILAWQGVATSQLWDVGELVAASVELGGSHAPGQPLHALLGYLVHLVPIGPIPFRITLLSVGAATLAAYVLGATVGELRERAAVPRGFSRIVVNAVALAVLVSPPVLRQAVRPEVYALALLGFAFGARALLGWARGDGRGLRVGALSAGLLLGVHPPHALALVALGLVVLVGRRLRGARGSWSSELRGLGLALAACLVGALILGYLPLRDVAGAPMWGDPSSLSGFFAYVSGSAYRGNLGGGEGALITALRVMAYLFVAGAGVAVTSLVTVAAFRARRPVSGPGPDPLWLAGLAAILTLSAACLQPHEEANPDNVAYAAPTLVLLLLASGIGLFRLAEKRDSTAFIFALMLPVGLPRMPHVLAVPQLLAAESPPLEGVSFALIDAPPPRAFVLVRTDFVAAAWMEADAVDRVRPDVALMVEGLATSSWHWRSLRHHPTFSDGRPTRASAFTGREAWVRGALLRASAEVPVVVESHATLETLGWLDGFYVRTPVAGAELGAPLRARRDSGERFADAVLRPIQWMAPGDHELSRDLCRSLALRRAERLWSRGAADASQQTLSMALSDLHLDLTPLEALEDPIRPAPPLVRSSALYESGEDGVRQAARLLFASGHPVEATSLLEAQGGRGDDLSLLQLGWLLLADGMTDRTEDILGAYRSLHGDDAASEALAEAISRARAGAAP